MCLADDYILCFTAAMHIEGAYHLPLSKLSTFKSCADFPEPIRKAAESGKEIVFFCRSGARSQRASSLLECACANIQHIASMKGGVIDWNHRIDHPSVVNQ